MQSFREGPCIVVPKTQTIKFYDELEERETEMEASACNAVIQERHREMSSNRERETARRFGDGERETETDREKTEIGGET